MPWLVRRRTTSPACSRWSPTFHHALHCVLPATSTSSNQELSGELVTVHSLSPHLVHGIAYRQNWNSCSRRQQHSGAIWSLFFFARRTDYVLYLRADCRRRTTNSAVTLGLGLRWALADLPAGLSHLLIPVAITDLKVTLGCFSNRWALSRSRLQPAAGYCFGARHVHVVLSVRHAKWSDLLQIVPRRSLYRSVAFWRLKGQRSRSRSRTRKCRNRLSAINSPHMVWFYASIDDSVPRRGRVCLLCRAADFLAVYYAFTHVCGLCAPKVNSQATGNSFDSQICN